MTFLVILLMAWLSYEAVNGIRNEVRDWHWRRSLPDEVRYTVCGYCGQRYDTTLLGSASEHWKCLRALAKVKGEP